MVCYSHLLKNFTVCCDPQSQRLGIVNKVKVDVFLELSYLSNDPTDVGSLISGSSVFSKSSLNIYESSQDLLELTSPKKDVLFIIGEWNAKVESQETPGVTSKFCLGVQNEAG